MDICCTSSDCQEFAKIPQDLTLKRYNIAKFCNEKNNFSNILSSDESRVILSDDTYINANFIFDQYIATQQPNVNTIDDFWQMVYETNSHLVINLCGDNNYLPEKSNIYRTIKLTIINNVDKENIQLRKIELSNNLKSKTVYHITFKKWKDFDIPTEKDMDRLLSLVEILDNDTITDCRMIIHCKAGVGRTGTFIMIHHILKKIKGGEQIDFLEIVKNMRKARIGMVQTKKQFAFVKLFVNQRYIAKPKSKLSSSCGVKNYCINSKKQKHNLSYSTEIVSKF
ncbi:protein-tyrosine phosphatase [Klosneuvirus KNV1]|uniref:Protein-tyrosine phosphatase n=1 Tax=Klosneuvirus KNV1 TaxID=1977640 RepID=A0A1V0SIP4_9VIRU|nr:protein-tyrosine phosphatase [Klosneuvirus KNV1]